jgi:NAD(P)-dependent dehydrogenase (short-subunit alcohol dehydrogenase family)
MPRTIVVTGAASGIGAATTRWLRGRGERVITSDLNDADVVADLATADGRAALADGVARLCGGVVDAVVANAGGGPAETSVQLNCFGAVATLEGLRPMLAKSAAPRAVAVSSIASLSPPHGPLAEACLDGDEPAALAAARALAATLSAEEAGAALYSNAKSALNRWCRRAAVSADWAGAGIALNVVALGFYDTPAARYILDNPEIRASFAAMAPLRGGFPGRPEAAASLLAWLVSAENEQVAGQVLYADAGFEAKARG